MKPLLMASWFGHYESVKMLLEAGADYKTVDKVFIYKLNFIIFITKNHYFQRQFSVLHCAVKNDHTNVANYLIDNIKDLDVDAIDKVI